MRSGSVVPSGHVAGTGAVGSRNRLIRNRSRRAGASAPSGSLGDVEQGIDPRDAGAGGSPGAGGRGRHAGRHRRRGPGRRTGRRAGGSGRRRRSSRDGVRGLGRGRASGSAGGGVAGSEQRTMVRSWFTVASGAISATRWSWRGSTLTATAAWSTVSCPSANSVEQLGVRGLASASRTRAAARSLVTPAFHVSQWVSERMPRPAQASVSRASATRSTSWAWRALSCPTTTARRSSMSSAVGGGSSWTDRTHVRDRECNTVRSDGAMRRRGLSARRRSATRLRTVMRPRGPERYEPAVGATSR